MIVIDPPAQLRNLDQWVGWKYETRDGDRTKVPYQLNGRRASSTDPTTWTAYDVVTSTDTTADTIFDGVGFVVSEYDSIIGVDLDHCVNPETGDLSPWAANVVTRLDSYTEITPSGEGLRIFVNGSGLPPHGRKRLVDAPPLTSGSGQSPALEIYDRGRYLTFTGQHVDGTPTTINVRGDAVRKIHAEYWPEKPPKPPRTPSATLIADDAELIRLAREAKNGGKFGALWTGDTTLHRGDDSAADAALVSMLAFWTACDPDRMDRLFRQSGLWRPKWDEQRGDRTYGVRTVDFAIEHCSETYDPRTITTGTIDSTSTISTTNHTNDISNSDHINDKAAVNTAVSEVSVNVTEPATAPLHRPVFPTWVIPDPLRSLIEDGARALGAPPDFIGAPALALVGGLLGNRYQIQVKKGWEQFPALWIATVGESGTAKTPALNLARRPLDCLQATAMETYREARQQYDADIVRWRSGNSDEPMPVKPVAEHLYTTDSTKEALVAMLQASAGLTFVRDELTAFIRSFDQYRGGKGGDRADWLSLHSSSPLKPDRKSQDPAYVQHPVVSVAGGIQPDLLHELRQDVEGNDGFTARMLFAYPACPEAPAWTEDEVDDSTITLVEMLYQTLRGTDISDPRG